MRHDLTAICWLLMQVSTMLHPRIKEAVVDKAISSSFLEFAWGVAVVGSYIVWVFQLPNRMVALEKGQASLEKGQASLEKGQASLEKRLCRPSSASR